MDVVWVESASELAERSAQVVIDLLDAKPAATIALPTGNTPLGLYRHLRKLHAAGRLDCARARFFNLDDFAGKSAHDPQSYAAFLWRHVFDPLEHLHGRDRGLEPEQRVQLVDETLKGLAVLRHGAFPCDLCKP